MNWIYELGQRYPERKKDFWRIVRFGVTGTVSSLLHYGLYCLVLPWSTAAVAYTVGYGVGLICNYVLTTYFTFQRQPSAGNAMGFVGSHILNYLLEIILLELFLWLGVGEFLAPILVMVIVVPINFLLLRYVFIHHSLPLFFVHDRGQMCNNILQFGHLYAWSRENNARALSTRFAYKYQYFHICRTRGHHFIVYALSKLAARLHLLPVLDFDDRRQADEAGMDALLRQYHWAWIDGWYVHFNDLFTKYRREICDLFAFLPEVEQKAQLKMMPWLTRENYIRLGVHIRRGDYARFLGGRYFYDDATMQRLIREFRQAHPEKKLVVYLCGNDPSLSPEAYRKAVPDVEFVFPKGNPGEDLCVLSHCDYLMGAPSTFSLVASMYRDVPLWWINDKDATLTPESFSSFDTLLRSLDDVFIDVPAPLSSRA